MSSGGDHAARAAVRADSVTVADDVRVELRQLASDAAVHARPQHRRRRAGRAGGHQRRRHSLAEDPADAADLLHQVESRRHADSDVRAFRRRACRSIKSTTTPTRSWRKNFCQVSGVGLVTINGGQKPAVRVQSRSRRHRRRGPQPGRHPRRAGGRQRQPAQGPTSTGHASTTRWPPTISCSRRRRSSRWSSPTKTVRRCGWWRSPTSSTASRTACSWPAGPGSIAPSSSTCSASRAPT